MGSALSTKKCQLARREIIRQAKKKPCADCHKEFPYYVMDFDHVRGKKKFELARAYYTKGLQAILVEIAKCDVVCSNCHRIRTHKRKEEIL